jgi:hypothetical protein
LFNRTRLATCDCEDCMLIKNCKHVKNLHLVVLIIFYYQQNIADDNNVIWHWDIHLKFNLFVWRLLRNRLSTKENLIKRAVISTNASHLFIHSDGFRQLWIYIYDWLGFVMITPYYLSDHLSRFSVLGCFSKYKRDLLQLI